MEITIPEFNDREMWVIRRLSHLQWSAEAILILSYFAPVLLGLFAKIISVAFHIPSKVAFSVMAIVAVVFVAKCQRSRQLRLGEMRGILMSKDWQSAKPKLYQVMGLHTRFREMTIHGESLLVPKLIGVNIKRLTT